MFLLLKSSHNYNYIYSIAGWTVTQWLTVALVPAGLYSIQNLAALTAYQNLDALTYNVLNQTKTLSAALCCYVVMGKTQSLTQVLALFLLLVAALVMEGIVDVERILAAITKIITLFRHNNEDGLEWRDLLGNHHWKKSRHFTHGVIPILIASFISGLAGALSQKNLQAVGGSRGRNAYLFSMELCAASSLILGLSLAFTSDGKRIEEHGFWDGWTLSTLIPIVTNSAGGIVVGLVTKHPALGSVRKGFALIFGILLSGIIQAVLQPDEQISYKHMLGGAVAAISLYLHAAYPPTAGPAAKLQIKLD
jgi:solute carrier family 35 (UDP-sugar transporter), member A1/2/3